VNYTTTASDVRAGQVLYDYATHNARHILSNIRCYGMCRKIDRSLDAGLSHSSAFSRDKPSQCQRSLSNQLERLVKCVRAVVLVYVGCALQVFQAVLTSTRNGTDMSSADNDFESLTVFRD